MQVLWVASLWVASESVLPVHLTDIDDSYVAPVQADPDSPTFAQGYVLNDAAKRGALCLDGSPPAHYHRKGTGSGANKWFVWQEGGAWCTDVGNCAARALTGLGSTVNDTLNTSLTGGYFDIDSSVNPLMYNWNAVWLRYCDGGSLMGDVSEPAVWQNQTVYLRGKRILEEQLQAVLYERGMDSATDVVFGGCSAGGLAVYLNCDKFAATVSAATNNRAKVTCAPDSGFFIDAIPRCHIRLARAFEVHNASSTVDKECLAKYDADGEAWKCFFPQWSAPYLTTPTFALQSQYDGWQMGGENVTSTNRDGQDLRKLLQSSLLLAPQHGVFLDSCSHHCGLQGPKPAWGSKDQPGSLVGGVSMGQALETWYNQGSSSLKNHGLYEQNQVFPCDDCCHGQAPVSTCPASHPWAYRPAAGFDYCCATADDNSGNLAVNARVNRSLRSNSCKDNNLVQCTQKPCSDNISKSMCGGLHPWAYRPFADFDFCCASADDNFGHVGINALADRSKRGNTCKDNKIAGCKEKPCVDYPTESMLV